jgi:hypothetical protein
METIHGKLVIRAYFANPIKGGKSPIVYQTYFVTRDEAQEEYNAFKLANDNREFTAYWVPTPEALN